MLVRDNVLNSNDNSNIIVINVPADIKIKMHSNIKTKTDIHNIMTIEDSNIIMENQESNKQNLHSVKADNIICLNFNKDVIQIIQLYFNVFQYHF